MFQGEMLWDLSKILGDFLKKSVTTSLRQDHLNVKQEKKLHLYVHWTLQV